MTDAELTSRLLSNVIAFKQLQAERGMLTHQALPGGVHAFCMPAHPEVLYFQQVYFTGADALAQALPAVEDFFRSQRVKAWRASVLPGDTQGAAVLGSAGYRPDERTAALGLDLERGPVTAPSIPLEAPETLEDLVRLNAVTWPDWSDVMDVWLGPPKLPVHTVVARQDGRALACGFALDQEDISGVYMVATAPEARGRGLASEVMHGLHAGARARGRKACVLHATPMGYGMYKRLGYRDLGDWVVWVHPAR